MATKKKSKKKVNGRKRSMSSLAKKKKKVKPITVESAAPVQEDVSNTTAASDEVPTPEGEVK